MGLIKLDDLKSARLWKLITEYRSVNYENYCRECMENKEYYFGEQWTEEEKKILDERGQYALTINKTRKGIRGIVGMLTANLPKYKAVPVADDDYTKVELGNKIIDWVWQNSGGIQAFRKIVKRAAVDNIAFFHMIWSEPEQKIKFIPLYYDDIIVDPNSKMPLFEDANMIFIKRYVEVETVKALYGVDELSTESPATVYDDRDTAQAGAVRMVIGKVFSADQRYVEVYEGYRKVRTRQRDGTVKTGIRKETVLGFKHAFVEDLPDGITEYPIIPVYAEDTENPYKKGEVFFLKDLQKFVNKSYGVVLLNAQLMSNPKAFVRETDIPNNKMDQFQSNYARPGSINVLTGDAEPPVIVQGQPLNSAFFTLYQDAKTEMEWNTVPNSLTGMDSSTPKNPNNSFLLDIKESVLDSFKDFASNIENACRQLGMVALQYAKGYMPATQAIRMFDPQKRIETVKLNRKMGLDASDQNSLRMFQGEMLRRGMPEEEIQAIIEKAAADEKFAEDYEWVMNGIEGLDLDIHIVPGSYSPTYEMAMLRLMMELLGAGAVDPSAVLKYIPVENRDELVQRYDLINQLQAQLNQARDVMTNYEKMLQSRDNTIAKQSVELKVQPEFLKIKRMQDELKLKTLTHKYENKLMTRQKLMELMSEIEKIKLDAKLEAEKAGDNQPDPLKNLLT